MTDVVSINPNDYKLYFDEEKHRYYDDFANPLTSVTTVIGKYEYKFDAETMARRCWKAGLKGNVKYRGKSVEQILREWKKTSDDALEQGNEKHNFLEVAVKTSSQYYKFHSRHPGNKRRLYTIPEVINNPGYGELSIDVFVELGIRERYPDIFNVILSLVNSGYRIYSEIGVFSVELLVSGLIDILFIRGRSFIILDWKTNKAPIRFDSGYWEKDDKGKLTNIWVPNDHMFKYPLQHLPSSIGNKYALQLGTYAYGVSQFGLKLEGLILCQIVQNDNGTETTKIDMYPVFMKEAEAMLRHHVKELKPNRQYNLLPFNYAS